MLVDTLRNAYYRLPQGLQRMVLVKRRQPIWLKAGILFIHIPKAAGTSVNEALYGRFMGHVRASDIQRWGSARLRALPSFAVTRNPWDRLVSAYRFAKAGHGVGGAIQAGVWKPEQYRVAAFETFELFVTRWLAKRDLARLDGIFQPQCLFVCDDAGKPLVDHVGRIENFQPTLDFIADVIGNVPDVRQANRSGANVDYRDFYSPKLVKQVGEMYRRDIEIFGYEF